jgi:hypothetical protein
MPESRARKSPGGRPVRIHSNRSEVPEWIVRRRRAYRLIDTVADQAKRMVRRWLLPRPAGARRQERRAA